jgi:hypothetical protein
MYMILLVTIDNVEAPDAGPNVFFLKFFFWVRCIILIICPNGARAKSHLAA